MKKALLILPLLVGGGLVDDYYDDAQAGRKNDRMDRAIAIDGSFGETQLKQLRGDADWFTFFASEDELVYFTIATNDMPPGWEYYFRVRIYDDREQLIYDIAPYATAIVTEYQVMFVPPDDIFVDNKVYQFYLEIERDQWPTLPGVINYRFAGGVYGLLPIISSNVISSDGSWGLAKRHSGGTKSSVAVIRTAEPGVAMLVSWGNIPGGLGHFLIGSNLTPGYRYSNGRVFFRKIEYSFLYSEADSCGHARQLFSEDMFDSTIDYVVQYGFRDPLVRVNLSQPTVVGYSSEDGR